MGKHRLDPLSFQGESLKRVYEASDTFSEAFNNLCGVIIQETLESGLEVNRERIKDTIAFFAHNTLERAGYFTLIEEGGESDG